MGGEMRQVASSHLATRKGSLPSVRMTRRITQAARSTVSSLAPKESPVQEEFTDEPPKVNQDSHD